MTEQLSALADNEIKLADAEHLLASMQANSPAAEAWSRYHLIGDVMRGTPTLSADFKANLMAKIDMEPTVLAPNAAWLKSAAKADGNVSKSGGQQIAWSMAASFAAVLVVGLMVLQAQVADPSLNANVAAVEAGIPTNAEFIPAEYLTAHQSSAPSSTSYYIQPASYPN
jgi:sigma-E factor negative regulatory protein RseA